MSTLEIIESPIEQGSEEQIVRSLTTTPWGSSPSSSSAKVFSLKPDGSDEAIDADVTSTVMPDGSASESGDVVTLPLLKLLTKDTRYRMEVKFTCSGNVFEAYAIIEGTR